MRTLTSAALLLVAFNLLPEFYIAPLWLNTFAVCVLVLRIGMFLSDLPMPPRWTLWGLQAIAVYAIWQQYGTIFGEEASSCLLVFLTCLKTFELRHRRDFFVIALLCLLILMSDVLASQSLSMTAFMILDGGLVLTFLMAVEDQEVALPSWTKRARTVLLTVARALPLLVVMFVLFPRFSTGFGLGERRADLIGIADQLDPGSLSRLIFSDRVVFRATFPSEIMPPRRFLYWRALVLDKGEGLQWSRLQNLAVQTALPDRTAANRVEIFLEPNSNRFLYSLYNTRTVDFPDWSRNRRVNRTVGGTFELNQPPESRQRYYLDEQEELSQTSPPLPVDLDPGIKESQDMRHYLRPLKGKSEGEIVGRLLDGFRKGGFHYSLQPPQVNRLDSFLFKTKTGFCEHFAAAMATMLRFLGVPSRVVVGFQGGTTSLLDSYVTVRERDAHAWVEYYDYQSRVWRKVDPTGVVAPARLDEGSEAYLQSDPQIVSNWMPRGWMNSYLHFQAFRDELEANWISFLLNYDFTRQRDMLARFHIPGRPVRALVGLMLAAVVLILSAIYIFRLKGREKLSEGERLYRRFLGTLARHSFNKGPSEGLLAFWRRIEHESPDWAEALRPAFDLWIRVRFGREPFTSDTAKSLKNQLRELRKLSIKPSEH